MGELGLNKIFGALLAAALAMMALMELPKIVFGGGASYYGKTEYATMTERMCAKFAYCVEIAEAAAAGGEAIAELFDLGAALRTADLSRGERVFASQCATCHTIAPGGANGTGPNLYDTVGASKAHIAGFNYSAGLANMGGDWSYENLDAWLKNPAGYLRGTSMSFAGIRRDTDRAAVIAYLAVNTANPPAFPEPLPAPEPGPGESQEPAGEEQAAASQEAAAEAGAGDMQAEPAAAPEPADVVAE
jgi:cytochrome c